VHLLNALDPLLIGPISILCLVFVILLGIPIAYVLGALGMLGIYLAVGPQAALGHLINAWYALSAQYSMAVLPLFVVIANFANLAGVVSDAFNAANKWFGRLPGGLAMTVTVASGFFAAVSGSTVANAAAFTPMALPEMLKNHYNKSFAAGCIAAVGGFAAMIPPSVTMVVYGIITGEPIGRLLIAGFIPGIIVVGIYAVAIYVIARTNPKIAPTTTFRATWKERLGSLGSIWGVGVIFLVIMGGMYTGIFAPSAAGAVGAFAAFLMAIFRKKLTWSTLSGVLLDSGLVFCTLFIILIGGSIFSRFWVVTNVITAVTEFIIGLSLPPLAVLIMILFLLLILGCFLDPPSIMVITLPLIYPVITHLGYNGIWFGVIMILVTEIAVLTPPVGFNTFVVHSAAGGLVELEEVFRGVAPFVVLDIIALALFIAFPGIVLWLPGMMK
jgi:C4-dicarboxylate transporter DctM subunit